MTSKVALIFIGNIEYCPYMKGYEKILKELDMSYDVLFWEREKLTAAYPENYKFFALESKLTKRKIHKIVDFIRYTIWLKKQLKCGKYTKIVYLDTLSGMLVYLSRSNIDRVPAILEIRDYSYERIVPFKMYEKKMILSMDKTFISSRAFLNFLPKCQYMITHNMDYDEYQQACIYRKFKKKSKDAALNIVYIGSVRYFKYQCAIIDELKNDNKFNVFYHGTGPDYGRLREYCDDNNIYNVHFTGFYKDYQKPDFYKEADFLINCYDVNIGDAILYAVSNKFYDGLIYCIPQLSESNTYKGGLVEQNTIGITWGPGEGDLKNKILEFYYGLNEETFNNKCNELANIYAYEYNEYASTIKEFINS